MADFTNIHGQAQSTPEVADKPEAPSAQAHTFRGLRRFNRGVEQMGLVAVDLEHCQAPTNYSHHLAPRMPCGKAPVCVMVENKPRPDGRVAAMSLCETCRDALLRRQGESYGKFTPIVPPSKTGAEAVALKHAAALESAKE